MKIEWPELTFPPVNLRNLTPAWWWYATPDEKQTYQIGAI